MEISIPKKIQTFIYGQPYTTDSIGLSGSQVLIFPDSVLKIEENSKSVREAVTVMQWLEDKISVPKVLCCEQDQQYQYLLMSRIKGQMACDSYFLKHPEELLTLLSDVLRQLWRVDISGCPRIRDLDVQLKEARSQVENHLVDIENTEPSTFGPGGFRDPEALLRYLEENRPEWEPVLSHGDFCLPNIFFEKGHLSGLIDLAHTGVSDKWQDIALCYRSLKHNFDGSYGGRVYPDFNPDLLFEKLGLEPNWEKIRYYLLLDELF